jgi:hypothetical protein
MKTLKCIYNSKFIWIIQRMKNFQKILGLILEEIFQLELIEIFLKIKSYRFKFPYNILIQKKKI